MVGPASFENSSIHQLLPRVVLLAAAGFLGFGIILWIAANWQEFDKFVRIGLVGSTVALSALVAIACPPMRIPASFIGCMATGALFAVLGQIYQSDADHWLLFAFWAGLMLPWAIGARSDAVWALFVIVTTTGIYLWINTQGALHAGRSIEAILIGWSFVVALAMLLSPWAKLEGWIGKTRWAFRLAVLLGLAIVVVTALPQDKSDIWSPIFWMGMLVTGCTFAFFAFLSPVTLSLLTLSAFAFDALLMIWIAKLLYLPSNPISYFFIVGICWFAIIGITGKLVIWLGEQGSLKEFNGKAGGWQWPVVLMNGIGALLAAAPIIIAISILLGAAGMKTVGVGGLGVLLIIAGMAASSQGRRLGLLVFSGLILSVVGLAFLNFFLSFWMNLPQSVTALVMLTVVIGLAVYVPKNWIASLFGAAAAGYVIIFIVGLALNLPIWLPEITLIASLSVSLVGALALIAVSLVRSNEQSSTTDARTVKLDMFAIGWGTTSLAALMMTSGPSFLLGGWQGISHMLQASIVSDLSLTPGRTLAVGIMAAAAWFFHQKPNLRTTEAYSLFVTFGCLAYVMPILAGAIVFLVAAVLTKRRIISILAVISGIWIIGSLYYSLGWLLINKAYLLIILGSVLFVVSFRWFLLKAENRFPMPFGSPTGLAWIASPLIALSVALTGGVSASTILKNEHIIANGRRVFVALKPVDPRSLMRGDYMRLRFNLPRPKREHRHPRFNRQAWQLIGSVDHRGVAKFTEYAPMAKTLASDELGVKVWLKGRQFVLGTTAFFFQEGTGRRYQTARFGEFIVAPNGRPILVGLADKDFRSIK